MSTAIVDDDDMSFILFTYFTIDSAYRNSYESVATEGIVLYLVYVSNLHCFLTFLPPYISTCMPNKFKTSQNAPKQPRLKRNNRKISGRGVEKTPSKGVGAESTLGGRHFCARKYMY